jgi:predicted pyridoxine 5'-phosphate oxidase superfamily flavin-nucleotide-binding protein
MADSPFKQVVGSLAELRAIVGEPAERSVKKETATLDGYARDFIAHAPFVLIATAGAGGRCDVSPKGGAPGFVAVLDETRLVVPDRPGNRRLDGMQNILQNGHAGLIRSSAPGSARKTSENGSPGSGSMVGVSVSTGS